MKKLANDERPFHLMALTYVKTVNVNDTPQPFHYITVFKRTRVDKTSKDFIAQGDQFRNDSDQIDKYITERGFNYASIILEDHFIILTEQPLGFDPLMVKLTTGVDLKGEWEFDLNKWLRQEGAEDLYPSIMREK